ncbi:hypothetical protein ACFOYU_16750 [Microvirga sp. GCM10011540]
MVVTGVPNGVMHLTGAFRMIDLTNVGFKTFDGVRHACNLEDR